MKSYKNAMVIKNLMEKFTGKEFGLYWDTVHNCYRTFPKTNRRRFGTVPCEDSYWSLHHLLHA